MARHGFCAGLFASRAGRRARSEDLLASYKRVEEELLGGDPAAAQALALAVAAALDLGMAEQPGPTPFFVTDLSPFGRGPKRMGCADLKELVERLRSLAEREARLAARAPAPPGPGPAGLSPAFSFPSFSEGKERTDGRADQPLRRGVCPRRRATREMSKCRGSSASTRGARPGTRRGRPGRRTAAASSGT